MGSDFPKADICKNCCSWFEPNIIYRDRIVFRDRQTGEIKKLSNDLKGGTEESISIDSKSNLSETTSEWNNSNLEHFEINILCGNIEAKFKVKKKYTISKVINRFIEYEKPKKVKGTLMRKGLALYGSDIIGELGISENETLELI